MEADRQMSAPTSSRSARLSTIFRRTARGVGRGFFEFIPARTINPSLSENFENIIAKALQVQPEDRFQTIREMREAHFSAIFRLGTG